MQHSRQPYRWHCKSASIFHARTGAPDAFSTIIPEATWASRSKTGGGLELLARGEEQVRETIATWLKTNAHRPFVTCTLSALMYESKETK
jgi:hypothetical protein